MGIGNKKYTRIYSGFCGVEREGSGSEISEKRLAYSENMYRDYDADGGEIIESVPGFRKLFALGKRINGIFIQKCDTRDYLVIHAANEVYRVSVNGRDTETPVKLGQINDKKSRAFSYLGDLFILDGEQMHRVDKYGELHTIVKNDPLAYVPTTFVGGVKCEMRNLLTDLFTEEMPLVDPYEFSDETDGLIYDVSDEAAGRCTVSGIKDGVAGVVYVPKYKEICGVKYRVDSISDNAFAGSTTISSVRIFPGVRKIGSSAFSGCTALKSISIPYTLEEIGELAFSDCTLLSEVYLGVGCRLIGEDAFENTPSNMTVFYGGTRDDFMNIEGVSALANKEILPSFPDRSVRLSIPVYSDVLSIKEVTVDGTAISFSWEQRADGIRIVTEWDEGGEVVGRIMKISGTLKPYRSYFRSESYGFYPEADGWGEDGFSAVTKCKMAELFDGRIFFAGSASLPGVVFYTERTRYGYNDPLYVGVYDYFRDGGYETASLLAVRDKLAHFKKGDSGDGGIFYHSPLETSDPYMPKAYPVSSVHSGVGAIGESVSFFDDPVFLSARGLSALRMTNIEYERSIETVSHNVNFDLLSQKLEDISMAVWQGYLLLSVGGNVFLADSRSRFRHETGDMQYEWFIMKGVGTWRGDYKIYRYSSSASDGYAVHPKADEPVEDIVYSEIANQRLVYYVEENFVKYEVYPTEERTGGSFDPANVILASGELLFFGTDGGDVCVFNNDKRGIAPDRIRLTEEFSEDEYSSSMGRYIHPDFYSFAGHAPLCAIKTKLDNCGIPNMTKDTVKGSLSIRCRGTSGSLLHIEVCTDKRGYKEISSFPIHSLDFSDLSFADVSLDTGTYISVPFGERERGWCEKQIAIYSTSFASPIAISSISYAFKLGGKIKKR